MAIVDNAFREWIADFKATNPDVADSRAILDTAQYAFAAGRKAQREIDAARQPMGQIVGYMDPDAEFLLPRPDGCVLMGKVEVCLWRTPGGKYTKPLYDAPAQAVGLERFRPAVMTALGLSSPYGLERETLNELLDLIDSQAVGK
ncbi:hypothetical protein C405_14628 [Stenotrophomonas maltophilia AU12-09]|uniref:hypothetical protein n=1 Tax=Stenotrophomonas maltophilia TaxID=40324 RepID=UPI0002BFEAC8|nr:hypothetical protein [Stenotrophomonas maltophilia]EMI48767.1 hypothetical protein C405_14628 [Stenotrophomonas maltophilia AU12-09]